MGIFNQRNPHVFYFLLSSLQFHQNHNPYVNSAGGSLVRGKVYKTKDASPTYLYVIVSTKLGATTPELNADTDYVVMGISH